RRPVDADRPQVLRAASGDPDLAGAALRGLRQGPLLAATVEQHGPGRDGGGQLRESALTELDVGEDVCFADAVAVVVGVAAVGPYRVDGARRRGQAVVVADEAAAAEEGLVGVPAGGADASVRRPGATVVEGVRL